MTVFEEVAKLFSAGAGSEYLGEPVTITEHMLQAAFLARSEGAAGNLIIAALLHDIGHLLVSDPLLAQESNIDAHHDEVGATWLSERFPESVSEPVRLHVDAKRYLVATDPSYAGMLSPASLHTLKLQGGNFTTEEITEFLSNPWAISAVSVRRWDDRAKISGSVVPDLNSYRDEFEKLSR
jgi:[1-hydroxy-2-(trimethylamino)ethyl]phosphonate dioxygenase